jgi:hypothetical protein
MSHAHCLDGTIVAIHNLINMTSLVRPRPLLTPDTDYVKSHMLSKVAVESLKRSGHDARSPNLIRCGACNQLHRRGAPGQALYLFSSLPHVSFWAVREAQMTFNVCFWGIGEDRRICICDTEHDGVKPERKLGTDCTGRR